MASQVQTQVPSVCLRILSIVTIWFGFLVKPNTEIYLSTGRLDQVIDSTLSELKRTMAATRRSRLER